MENASAAYVHTHTHREIERESNEQRATSNSSKQCVTSNEQLCSYRSNRRNRYSIFPLAAAMRNAVHKTNEILNKINTCDII